MTDPIREALELEMEIGAELYEIIQRLGARSDLLATFGSWSEGDLSAEEVLVYLKAYNRADREEREDVGRRVWLSNRLPDGMIPDSDYCPGHAVAELVTRSDSPHVRCRCGMLLKLNDATQEGGHG